MAKLSFAVIAGLLIGAAPAQAHYSNYHHNHRDGSYYYDGYSGRRYYECNAGSRYEGCYRPGPRRGYYGAPRSTFGQWGIQINGGIFGIF